MENMRKTKLLPRKRLIRERKRLEDVTFNPERLCPDWYKLKGRDLITVFKWFAERGSDK